MSIRFERVVLSHAVVLHVACCETFSRNANGVRAIKATPAYTPTPLALGLNVETAHFPSRKV
jgi:hypothetical protein